MSYGLDGVRRKAESDRNVKFTSLLHHVTATLLRESYYQLRKDAAAGVDEETWLEYYEGHWDRIEGLRERIHKGSYRNHEILLNLLKKRVGDKRVLRLVSKWIKTGYIENGKRVRQEIGTPQGSVISPLLANIYLHYVLDIWASMWRKTNAKGDMIIVRYADDFVIGFQYYEEAVKFLADLHGRLLEYKLTLHPQKTRLIEFGKYASGNRNRKGKGKPETFDFLGFTHICSKNRKGDFFLRRKTKRKQLKKKLKEVKDELRKRMHKKIKETGKWLATVITGHKNYFAVPGNMDAVKEFYRQCMRQWLRTLRRRSHKAQKLTWEVFLMKVEELIPRPRMVHPFPEQRFWRQKLDVGAVSV